MLYFLRSNVSHKQTRISNVLFIKHRVSTNSDDNIYGFEKLIQVYTQLYMYIIQ